MPRQATEFTQHLMPEEALLAPEATWNTLHGSDSTAWLTALWEQAHLYAGAKEPPAPAAGLQAEQSVAGTHEAVLISLPTPRQAPDAWYALLVRTPAGPAPFRYFTLEVPADFEPAPPDQPAAPGPTRLTEHLAETGTHRQHGPGPLAPTATTVARLLVAVGRLLAAPPEPEMETEDDDLSEQPTI